MRLTTCTALLLASTLGCAPEPPPEAKPTKAPAADLDAFAAARAGSDGAKLEAELAHARSLNAEQAFQTKEEPRTGGGGGGEVGFDEGRAGSSAPSDLDTLDDAPKAKAWINMDAVEQRILGKSKSLQSCWESAGRTGGARMELRMTIDPTGHASSVRLAPGSPETDPAVADCAARTLRNLRYPEPRGGSVTFVYPVKF